MKKVFMYFLMFFLFIPFVVNAKLLNYENSIKDINNFINKSEFSDRNKYLLFNNGLSLYDENNSLFKNGGFLSLNEFNISKRNGKSYLSPGLEYWTLTSDGDNKKYVISTLPKSKNKTDVSNVRVTEYIKKGTKIKGKGTYTNPWIFEKTYLVQVKSSNTSIGKINNEEGISRFVSSGDDVSFSVNLIKGYNVKNVEGCNPSLIGNDVYRISNVKNDLSCLVKFTERVYTYNLDENPNPNKIYLKYKKGWYSDSEASTSISSITPPTKVGYSYGGYYSEPEGEGVAVINQNGIIITSSNVLSLPNDNVNEKNLYSLWFPITYKVALDNQGATTAGTTTIYQKYNTGWYSNSGTTTSISSITIPAKTGYTFGGYYTSTTGGGTQIINASGTILDGKTTTFSANGTLYAKWTPKTYTITLNNQSATTAGTTTIYEKYNTGWYSNSSATTSISSITVPTRTSYTFEGYYTATNGGGTQIINASGNILSGKTTSFSSNTTLYAKWKSNKVEVQQTSWKRLGRAGNNVSSYGILSAYIDVKYNLTLEGDKLTGKLQFQATKYSDHITNNNPNSHNGCKVYINGKQVANITCIDTYKWNLCSGGNVSASSANINLTGISKPVKITMQSQGNYCVNTGVTAIQ